MWTAYYWHLDVIKTQHHLACKKEQKIMEEVGGVSEQVNTLCSEVDERYLVIDAWQSENR